MNKVKIFDKGIAPKVLEKQVNEWLEETNGKVTIHKMYLTGECYPHYPGTFWIWYSPMERRSKRRLHDTSGLGL